MTAFIRIDETPEPDAPPENKHTIFVDETDGRLAKKDEFGTVEKFAGVGGLVAEDFLIEVIGTPTYDNIQQFINLFGSAGTIEGGAITDAGGGNINVAAGSGFIRIADDDQATLKSFDWIAESGIAIPSNSTRYVGIDYNAGAPEVLVLSTDDWDYDTQFPLGTVVHENGNLYIVNRMWKTTDAIANIIERFDAEGYILRDNRVGGLILSGTGTRNVAVTAGQLLSRLNEYPIAAIDTSGADTFEAYYRDGLGAWTLTTGQTQWNNSQWDDGDGTLAALTTDYYTSRWFYMTVNGKLLMIFGQAEYATLGGLLAGDAPPSTPKRVEDMAVLIGRLIIKEGETAPEREESAFSTVFEGSVVSDHGALSGLGDDDHTQYHTDARAVTWINSRTFISSAQTITTAGSLTLPHSLSAAPSFFDYHLVNVAAEHGYTAGQIATPQFNAQDGDRGVMISPDATNLNIRFGNAAAVFKVMHRTSGNTLNITNANWQIVFKARL